MLEELLNPYHPLFWVFILVIIGVVFWILLRPFLTTMRFVYPSAKYEAMGNPYVKEKNLKNGKIELKTRRDKKSQLIDKKDVTAELKKLDKKGPV